MALDIRLDFIQKIDPEYIKEMSSIRDQFRCIDSFLCNLADKTHDGAALRAIALSRTNNEIACQYAIKSLCIVGEIKD